MTVQVLTGGAPYASVCYLVSAGGESAVVDPSVPYDAGRRQAGGAADVRYILLTHSHFDHMLYLDDWQRATGAEVLVGTSDRDKLADPVANVYAMFLGTHGGYTGESTPVSDGDTFSLGGQTFAVLALPGHTSGSVGYRFVDALFCGDLVFAGGNVGRCDLPSGDSAALRQSVRRLLGLPPDTCLYPGHGPATTVGELCRDFGLSKG